MKKLLKSTWHEEDEMILCLSWLSETAKRNLDNWTIDNDPENSKKRKFREQASMRMQPKNSNNGIGKLVVFLNGIKLDFNSRWGVRENIFYESLILAQDERWRRA